MTYRAGQLFDGLVNDYLDGEIITEEAFPGGSFVGETRNDHLYIGDVRGGLQDGFAGADPHDIFVAEVLVYNTKLNEDQIVGIGEWLRSNLATASTGEPCDFDGSGVLDVGDIDAMRDAIIANSVDPQFDLNQDGQVDTTDLAILVESPDKFNTYMGDANLDDEFNSGDLVLVLASGSYEVDVASDVGVRGLQC